MKGPRSAMLANRCKLDFKYLSKGVLILLTRLGINAWDDSQRF
jgi:hypothetical protein